MYFVFDHAFFVSFVIVYINMIVNFKNLLFTFPWKPYCPGHKQVWNVW